MSDGSFSTAPGPEQRPSGQQQARGQGPGPGPIPFDQPPLRSGPGGPLGTAAPWPPPPAGAGRGPWDQNAIAPPQLPPGRTPQWLVAPIGPVARFSNRPNVFARIVMGLITALGALLVVFGLVFGVTHHLLFIIAALGATMLVFPAVGFTFWTLTLDPVGVSSQHGPGWKKPVTMRWEQISHIGPEKHGLVTYLCVSGESVRDAPSTPLRVCPLGWIGFPAQALRATIWYYHPNAPIDPRL
jgi:hypothetical protein